MEEPLKVYETRTFICPRVEGFQLQIAVVPTGVTRLHRGIILEFSKKVTLLFIGTVAVIVFKVRYIGVLLAIEKLADETNGA